MSDGRRSSSSPSKKGSSSRVSPALQAIKAAKKKAARASGGGKGSDHVVLCDPFQAAHDAKDAVRGKTGLAFDEAMLDHINPWDPEHIECPKRLERTLQRCAELGLVQRCQRISSRKADDAELTLMHSQAHLDVIKSTVGLSVQEIKSRCLSRLDNSVFMSSASMECARMATAAAVDVAKAVYKGDVQNGMALVRPPGHHAGKNEIIGFCLTNHVAVAARHLLENEGAKRVMIVDFDVHHGQGTQREFYDNPSVLYVSIHRYEYATYWPHLRESDYDYVGQANGEGFNVNIPLNEKGLKDADYLAVFHQVIMPMGFEFNPDIVLVSAGYDAAIGCPEGEMALSPAVYGHLTSSLMSLANGKVAAVMEGGYFIESLADGVAMTLRALLGDRSCPLEKIEAPTPSLRDSVLNCLSAHRSFWQMLKVQDEYSISSYDATKDEGCHEPAIYYEGDSYVEAREQSKLDYDPKNFYWQHDQETMQKYLDILCKLRQKYAPYLNTDSSVKKVAIVYDQEMLRHSNLESPSHPERPQRISSMMKCLEDYGLTEREELMRIDSRRATKEEVCLCHDEKHFEAMRGTVELTQEEREKLGDSFDSIYFNEDSFDSALLSCGCLLNLVDCVCNGDSLRGAAIIRPPGHHAEADEACGFCLFNNVAIAAKYALDNHGLKRVLILDWDVHHGNGIQNMFYDDDRVLYISLHRFDHGTFFPGREDANCSFVGEGRGEGKNINIPFNGAGMGDTEYLLAFFSIVLPVCYQFDPELVLVSAGFDAARGDPLGQFKLSPQMYGHMTRLLANLAGGRVIVALEGGYNLNSISLSMTMCVKALLDDPMPHVDPVGEPKPSAVQTVRDVVRVLSPYWSSLAFGLKLPDSFEDLKESLAAVSIRAKPTPGTSGHELASSPYIPSEYGIHTYSSCVNTMSNSSGHRTEPHETDSKSESKKEHSATDDLAGKLSSLAVAAPTSDYVPSQYGAANTNTPCVNTMSQAKTLSTCEVTGAPKQACGSAAGSRDASTDRKGQED